MLLCVLSVLPLYLSVDDGGHPEAFAGSRDGQHGPEEDEDGQHQRGHRGGDHVVEDDDQVADHLGVGHQHVVEGVAELQQLGLPAVEALGLLQLLVVKHPEGHEGQSCSVWGKCFLVLL